MRVIDFSSVQNLAVGVASAVFADDMAAQTMHRDNTVYEYTADVASWIIQGAAPVATAGTAGELYVPAGGKAYLSPKDGAKLAVIRASGDGIATLALTRQV